MIKHLYLFFLIPILFAGSFSKAQRNVGTATNQDSSAPAGVSISLVEEGSLQPLDSVKVTWSDPNRDGKKGKKSKKPIPEPEWFNKILYVKLEVKWPARFDKPGYEPGYLSDRSFTDKQYTKATVCLKKKKSGVRLVPVK